MTLVPRIFERVLAGVIGKARAGGGLRAKLVPWALAEGREYMRSVSGGTQPSLVQSVRYQIAQRLVLSKVRPALGLDRLEFFISGSAPLHRDIALTYLGFGVPICQGYGLTETSPVVSVNRLDTNRLGTVGRPIPNVEVRIADDGEILVRGPNVMKGYYHRTESPIDADGWFATGDIGELDAGGFLTITDRKKELFKTSGGKFVSPSRVEAAIKRSPQISQAMVVGDGRPFPVALIAPNWPLVRSTLEFRADQPADQLAKRNDVIEFLRRDVERHTADLGTFEQIRRIALLPRELTIEDGELSPALKLKRRVIESRYGDLVNTIYEAH